jgi:hypothetical protein
MPPPPPVGGDLAARPTFMKRCFNRFSVDCDLLESIQGSRSQVSVHSYLTEDLPSVTKRYSDVVKAFELKPVRKPEEVSGRIGWRSRRDASTREN